MSAQERPGLLSASGAWAEENPWGNRFVTLEQTDIRRVHFRPKTSIRKFR